jgi:hypothetical protein
MAFKSAGHGERWGWPRGDQKPNASFIVVSFFFRIYDGDIT